MKHEIDIQIGADGEVSLKVRGLPGDQCLELTRAIEEELGLVISRERTSEFYQSTVDDEAAVKIGED